MPGSGKNISRVLLVRNDRIGDLVLTTPAFAALSACLPGARIDLLCSSYAEAVVRGNPYLHEVLTDRGAHDSGDLKELVELVAERKYDCAVVMVHSLKNARLVRMAHIPLRIGPLVRWYAPLFFNRAIRQRRSLAEKSEALYNLELLAPLGVEAAGLPPTLVIPTPEGIARAKEIVEKKFPSAGKNPLVVVHPGMGGSALNWPEDLWEEMVRLLAGEGRFRVLVTGSDEEIRLVERVTGGQSKDSRPVQVQTALSLEDFIGLLSLCSAVVAPSTGPLHLAGALGVPVVAGIYSPVRAQHPRRWGPLGRGTIRTFVPDAICPGTLTCPGDRCPLFPCMELIEPVEVLRFILSALNLER